MMVSCIVPVGFDILAEASEVSIDVGAGVDVNIQDGAALLVY